MSDISQSQWLNNRNLVSDWLTPHQAENKSRVSLMWQSFSLAAHPLFMAVFPSVTGLETVGMEMTEVSKWIATDKYYLNAQTGAPADPMHGLYDGLGTDDGRFIVDDDTGRPIGITVSQGFQQPISPAVGLHHGVFK